MKSRKLYSNTRIKVKLITITKKNWIKYLDELISGGTFDAQDNTIRIAVNNPIVKLAGIQKVILHEVGHFYYENYEKHHNNRIINYLKHELYAKRFQKIVPFSLINLQLSVTKE